jgi:hypothetical protein
MRIFLLLIALLPVSTLASPALRMLTPEEQAKMTEVVALVQLTAKSTRLEGRFRHSVFEVAVSMAQGAKATSLPAGTRLRFEHRCAVKPDPAAVPRPNMTGYPNGLCTSAWSSIPAFFGKAVGDVGPLPLTVSKDGVFRPVASTRPSFPMQGKIIK